MHTIRAKELSRLLQINAHVVGQQLDGLSDSDLLLQPQARGNCANWILGHLVVGRNNLITMLGAESLWTEEESKCYAFGSEPITGPDSPHLPMARLLADYKRSGAIITEKFAVLTDEDWDAAISEDSTLYKSVSFSVWHEAYHVGQLEYLRQLTGINDKVI